MRHTFVRVTRGFDAEQVWRRKDVIQLPSSEEVGKANRIQTAQTLGIRVSRHHVDSVELPFEPRNVSPLVITIEKKVLLGLEHSCSISLLVQSLIWPFVARRSMRKELFSDKELSRFIRSMRETAQRLIKTESGKNDEQTYLKYWLDSYLALGFKDADRPTPLDEHITKVPLFTGWCKRNIVRAIARRDIPFLYSLQKGAKRMWPQLGREKERSNLEKHRERISTFHGDLNPEFESILRATSLEVFRGINENGLDFSKFMPSSSACIQASLREGGALALAEPMVYPWYEPGHAARFEIGENTYELRRGLLPSLVHAVDGWRQRQFHKFLDQAWENLCLYDVNGRAAGHEVSIVTVPEPSKWRIISKGDGYLYSALQPLQGAMLKAWKNHPASTMLEDDLYERVNKMNSSFPEFWWFSGDYEAATDLIKKSATLCAFSGLRQELPFVELGFRSLNKGHAIYPRAILPIETQDRLKADQKNKKNGTPLVSTAEDLALDSKRLEGTDIVDGQLMGHPLSFPLLCIINLAVYRYALKLWVDDSEVCNLTKRERREVRKAAQSMRNVVKVNGDDILFKAPREFLKFFHLASSEAGFKISQGKNYVSPDCCMINSQVFKQVRTVSGVEMVRQGYLNMKLIKGTGVKTGDSAALPTQISRDLNRMGLDCPWTACAIPEALNRFNKFNHGFVYRPNWYLPVHLGGFGMDPALGPSKLHVSRRQRILASMFVSNPSIALYRSMGKARLPCKMLKGALANWAMVPGMVTRNSDELFPTEDEWLGRLAYAARAVEAGHLIPKKSELGCGAEAPPFMSIRHLQDYRLTPMTDYGLAKYRNVTFIAKRTPLCPPVCQLRDRPSSRCPGLVPDEFHVATQEYLENHSITESSRALFLAGQDLLEEVGNFCILRDFPDTDLSQFEEEVF